MMTSKTESEELLKTFLIVSQHREFAGILLFFNFLYQILQDAILEVVAHFCSVGFFPTVFFF